VRRSSIRALAERLDVPLVALLHASDCPHAERVTASRCTCKTALREIPRDEIDAFMAEEAQLARIAAN